MRFAILGAGAIGGLIGARLHQGGHDVTLIARGAHYAAIARHGLVLETPSASEVVRVPAVDHPGGVAWADDTVLVLAVKSQDTEAACESLARVAPDDLAVVCAQNGVENERRVSRRYARTYAMCVMCPASHLDPGTVVAHSEPISGLLDVGRYPGGSDPLADRVCRALAGCTFDSVARPDIMR